LSTPANADPSSANTFFLSPSLIKVAEPVLDRIFTQAGWSGRDAHSFLAFLRAAGTRAQRLSDLPDNLPTKAGLRTQLADACASVMSCAGFRRKTSLKTPLADVVGDASFVLAESAGERALAEYDADAIRIIDDMRLTVMGRSVGAPSTRTGPTGATKGAASSAPSHLSAADLACWDQLSSAGRSIVSSHQSGYDMPSASQAGDGWKQPQGVPFNYLPGYSNAAGGMSQRHGVWIHSPTSIIFGDRRIDCSKGDTSNLTCAGSWAEGDLRRRYTWCSTPWSCTRDGPAHHRPSGTTDADFVASKAAQGDYTNATPISLPRDGKPDNAKGGKRGGDGRGKGRGGKGNSGKGKGGKDKGSRGKGGNQGTGKRSQSGNDWSC